MDNKPNPKSFYAQESKEDLIFTNEELIDELAPPNSFREDERIRILAEIIDIATHSRTNAELYEGCIQKIFDAIPNTERATILVDHDGELIPVKYIPREQGHYNEKFVKESTVKRKAFSLLRNQTKNKIPKGMFDMEAAMYAPMIRNGKVVGVLHVDSTSLTQGFSKIELDTLSVIASILALCLNPTTNDVIPRDSIQSHLPGDSTTDAPPPDVKKEKNAPAEEVSFTAYHPKEGSVESWHTLLVYTHLLSVLAKVQEDAKRFDDQIKLPKETTSKSSTPILRGMELTIAPSCEGVTFNPERVSLKWMEDFHRADFRFKADKSLTGDAAKGSIDIYVGPLIIGTLKFAMLFNGKDIQPVLEHEESAKMYGKDDVFISYSRKDTDVARTFKTVLESTGLDVFLDVDDIRSGQLWEEELKRRIEQAKIFQIFWSPNYNQSKNCKKEWKYALEQNKDEGYIRPVYWNTPLSPKPPEELNKFNFKYVELKIASDE